MTAKEREALVHFAESIQMAAGGLGGSGDFAEPWVKCIYSSASNLVDALMEKRRTTGER